MMRLNSRGFLLSLKEPLQRPLILYNQTRFACKECYHHGHKDDIGHYKYVDIQSIVLFEDSKTFRGI